MPGRSAVVPALLLTLAALGAGACSTPDPAPAPIDPVAGPIGGPKTPGQHPMPPTGAPNTRGVRIAANVLDVSAETIHVIGPEGEGELRLAPHALDAAKPTRGDTVTLECAVTPQGALLVRSIAPHTGLGLYYGVVAESSATTLLVHSPLGDRPFVVNEWSDLPVGLKTGEFISVKHYKFDAGEAILNARRFPGWVEEAGELTSDVPTAPPSDGAAASTTELTFSTRTLGGVRRYPSAAGATKGWKKGELVLARYHRGAESPFVDLTFTPLQPPLAFIGKLSVYDAATRTFSMVDAWSDVLGIVRFHAVAPPAETLVPGDLVDVRYVWGDDELPTIESLEERLLSTVFFGRIEELDQEHVRLTTLQGQPKLLRVDARTWLPGPVQPGDMADVIWRADEAGGPPHAEVIVKE